jgi:hypothetical protein
MRYITNWNWWQRFVSNKVVRDTSPAGCKISNNIFWREHACEKAGTGVPLKPPIFMRLPPGI